MTIKLHRTAWIAASVMFAGTALAACGSDSESDDASASGDSIKVMVYGPIDAPGFAIPGIETGARAGVDKVNESGGIGGRDLELIVCNDKNDPNAAVACGRQAVEEGVVAVIGGLSQFEPQLFPVLEKAGIPILGPTVVSTFTTSTMYPIAGGAPGALFALGKYMAQDPQCGGTVGAVIEDFSATQGAVALFGLGVQVGGADYVGYSGAPQGAADFAPAVSAATEKSECLGYLANPTSVGNVVRAIVATGKVKVFGGSESIMPDEVLQALGDTADGNVAFSSYLPLNDSTDTPEMKEFLERARAIDEDFSAEQTAASAYLSPIILQKALDGTDVSSLASADVIAALDSFSAFDTGLGPVVDFTAKNPTKAFSRMPYATPAYQWVAKGGRFELGDAEPLSLEDVYDAASAAGQ